MGGAVVARRYRGPYAAASTYPVPYATAAVWGTGIDAVHSYYGEGPPVRILGRAGTMGSSPVGTQAPMDREYQQPGSSSPLDPPEEVTWGYPALDYTVDSFGSGASGSPSTVAPRITTTMDDRPEWSQDVSHDRARTGTQGMPSWGSPAEFFRGLWKGAGTRTPGQQGSIPGTANELPNETVSEGWINKATSFTAYATPSDPSQYEVQTSMRQRFGTRDNVRAQQRGTDDARSKIASRVEAMVEKVYSTGERNYDMFPYQIDQMERPFRFRTAGTGPAGWMLTNEYGAITPVMRTPPPDPAQGVPEVGGQMDDYRYAGDYGYTTEDTMYYA